MVSRARYSQSTVRRFRRWLDNDKIDVHTLYGPLMQQAIVGWVGKTALCGVGYLDVVEYLLHGALVGDLPP